MTNTSTRPLRRVFFPLLFLLLTTACGRSGSSDRAAGESPVVSFDTTSVLVRTATDTLHVHVEIAGNEDQRRHGLMERRELAENAGMLFIYDETQPAGSGFWMFRTRLPLDIAFLNEEGVIVSILQMTPCESPNPQFCPSYAPDVPYRHALEMNHGYFSRHGVAIGDRVVLR